ncbi:uncharacterized protein BT62DRAFT_171651 [Guyanagaster necrorhizus]|uniref:DUF6534 domain-containing protein n=1 Tax=Guyanagaster necrorhizus TaxID=856835 RepID=A0A9P8ARR8_9AGAR|nr:uncharacterized protein BT62DRAFT_171651 [Guyanagaster necrorhizus MCA 3950]KAG7445653.1 hypothetical protein BT62DRAFT_171651 [Guyanagaster necrorhizus MCA 3950]
MTRFLTVLRYFRHGYGSKDSRIIKAMVLALGCLATVHVATFVAWAYDDLISRFGAFDRLDAMPRTALVQLLAIYMVSFISQCFFTTRIWILTHKWYLASPIAILALINIIAGITQTTLSGIGAAATAACDLLITATLCWILNKKRTGIKMTDTLLDNLIILAINRGAVTSLAALFNLILFVWRPDAMIFMSQLS